MRLHSYFRSGAAWRVRIGLHWKGVAFETVAHDLRTGAQTTPAYVALNPQGMIPALELADGTVLTQSLAILEWLEETRPEPSFFPEDTVARAQIRAAALAIAADTHPLQNLGVLKRIEALAGPDGARHWAQGVIERGLTAVERLVARHAGPFAFGAAPTLADILIVPQLFNARRFAVDLAPLARIRQIEAACAPLPAFAAARPEAQPDYDG